MGICPDCGGWIDEGDSSCSCGSTRGTSGYERTRDVSYESDASGSYEDDGLDRNVRPIFDSEESIRQRKLEEENRKVDERLKKQREMQRQRAEEKRRQKEYEEEQRRIKEENERNPQYLAEQIERVKSQIYRNKILLVRGPEHLKIIQEKIDNAFREIIRLEDKLAAFEIPESDEFEYLSEKIKSLKKENSNINYIISHMDEAYCDGAKKVFLRNRDKLEELEAKFDDLYPKRGFFNRRDVKKRTKINLD